MREPEIYGFNTLKDLEQQIISFFESEQIRCSAFQSNHEGVLVDWLHENRKANFLLINPGALTHTSIVLRDAILGINIPFVEIHISNIFKRESFRHFSYFSDIAIGSVIGMGLQGYELAAQFALKYLNENKEE